MQMRVGTGTDVHELVAGPRLVIGGVEIDHPMGLKGHSDADVLLHAVCDALLGAAGLGDINGHQELSHLWSSKMSHPNSFYKPPLFFSVEGS